MAAATKAQPGHDIVTVTGVQLLGVGIFTIIAGINDDIGGVMVVIMWGIFLGWLLLHNTELQKMVKAL